MSTRLIRIFKSPLRKGDPVSTEGFVDGINKMARAWETLDMDQGYVEWINGRPTIFYEPDPEDAAEKDLFNGRAYFPNGQFVDNLDDASKPYIKFDMQEFTITEEAGPPPTPWEYNAQWRRKIDVHGAAYFS